MLTAAIYYIYTYDTYEQWLKLGAVLNDLGQNENQLTKNDIGTSTVYIIL